MVSLTLIVTAKNLNKPGACAKPTAVKTFLKLLLFVYLEKSFTPITKIKIAQINQVKIAASRHCFAVLIIVLAATAPGIPSKIK